MNPEMSETKEVVQQVLVRLDRGWSHPAWDYPTDKIHKLLSAVYAHPAILESTCGGCEEIQNAIDAITTDLLMYSFDEENYVDDEIDDHQPFGFPNRIERIENDHNTR